MALYQTECTHCHKITTRYMEAHDRPRCGEPLDDGTHCSGVTLAVERADEASLRENRRELVHA